MNKKILLGSVFLLTVSGGVAHSADPPGNTPLALPGTSSGIKIPASPISPPASSMTAPVRTNQMMSSIPNGTTGSKAETVTKGAVSGSTGKTIKTSRPRKIIADLDYLSIVRQRESAEKKDVEKKITEKQEIESDTFVPNTDYSTTVLPEVPTPIEFSSTDVNRITCPNGFIKDIVYSKEKGITIKYADKDAFVKFLIKRSGDGKETYATAPVEMFIVCGESVYTVIAFPKKVTSKLVKLSSGARENIQKNNELFAGMAYEKKILNMLTLVHSNTSPDSFAVKNVNEVFDLFRDIKVTLKRLHAVDGEGFTIKEFIVELREGVQSVEFDEKEFLRPEFARHPAAIAIDRPKIKSGGISRVFIVEKNSEGDGNQ